MNRRAFLFSTTALALTGCSNGASYGARAEDKYPPLGQFLEVEEGRVHYIEGGEGPTVILIHGANGNLRDWTFSMFAKLAETHHVIAFDRPGLGYSDRAAKDGSNPEVQARILSSAAEQLGVTDAVIVGHSWGGAVAAAWALNHAEQIKGIAMLAGATHPWGGDGVFVYKLAASPSIGSIVRSAARAYITPGRQEQFLADVFFPNEPIPGYIDYIGIELALRPNTFLWNSQDLAELNGHLERMAPRYPAIRLPMEILHGENDQTVWASVHSQPLHDKVRDSNLTMLPGVGHMMQHIAEGEVIAAIEKLARPV
ncbi:MAG: alpha/beta fold hydrolase [Pikeienuella sp.]